jgi:hypothetical protein
MKEVGDGGWMDGAGSTVAVLDGEYEDEVLEDAQEAVKTVIVDCLNDGWTCADVRALFESTLWMYENGPWA